MHQWHGQPEFATWIHELDYLEHTLTIKKRDGRTYNFTDDQDTADALFSFHREVEQARQRMNQ